MSTLQALLERVEKAEGPDRLLDAWIWIRVGGRDDLLFQFDGTPMSDEHLLRAITSGDKMLAAEETSPRYTASLDAAVGLVEKMLPEMNVSVTRHSDGRGACEMWVWVSNLFDDTRALNEANGHESRHQNVGAATPALALIAALLKALIEGERTKVLSQEMGD